MEDYMKKTVYRFGIAAVFVLAAFVLGMGFFGCDSGDEGGNGGGDQTYAVGDTGPAGGIIFYDKGATSDGWRYLEAAPADLGTAQWGAKGVLVGGTAPGIGKGKRNTELIAAKLATLGESGKAAQLCVAYRGGGKSDWFLPSRYELDLMYTDLKVVGLGGFSDNPGNDNIYWSSTEYGEQTAWDQAFGYGSQNKGAKNYNGLVRAVRQF
jgi:hypothetical protein